tara:strand:- start:16099 stop:17277 length:1179 start_codon:yes stop_codon:yes gene_type:complete
MTSSCNFYEKLVGFSSFSQFAQLEWYSPLPSEWFVVITDIQGSTSAIEKGLYKEVNSIGAASIVALLNVVAPLKVPYVFGGDGSTLCIPPSKKKAVESALVATKQMAKNNFGMQLRIGMVPMSIIKDDKHQILVGKYKPSPHFQQAMFQGDGLGYAESLVKDPGHDNPYLLPESKIEANGSFEGFECRWNEIPSPHEETVAILVQALEQKVSSKETIYNEVSQKILDIYGHEENHHPLQLEQLSLTSSPRKLSIEARIRTAFQTFWKRWMYALKLELLAYIGKFLMVMNVKTKNVDWGQYKQKLIANTDYRKFDEILRMILSGTLDQRNRLIVYLKQLHEERKIVFGIHASPSALMTCLIFNYDTDHIHFLDGSNGGYAMAAKEMKRQLKEL